MIVALAIMHVIVLLSLLVFGILALVEANGNSFIIPGAYAIAYTVAFPVYAIIMIIIMYVIGKEQVRERETRSDVIRRLLGFNYQSLNPEYFVSMWSYYFALFATYVVVVAFYWTWVARYSFKDAPDFYVLFINVPLIIWIVVNLTSAVLNFVTLFVGWRAFSSYLSITFARVNYYTEKGEDGLEEVAGFST